MFNLGKRFLSGLLCSGLILSSIGSVWADEQVESEIMHELTVRSSKGGEISVSYNEEVIIVSEDTPLVVSLAEGTDVSVSAVEGEGYQLETLNFVGEDGSSLEYEGSFTMTSDVMVEGVFSEVDEVIEDSQEDTLKEEDYTQEVKEDTTEVLDPVEEPLAEADSTLDMGYSFTKDYFVENLNTFYIESVEKFQMVNGITTKLSIFDGNYINGSDDLDSIFADWDRLKDAYIATTGGVVPVFDVNAGSDYYIALVDTMFNDSGYVLQDYDFALNSLDGEVLKDAILENKGIGYIPKKYFSDEIANVQVQIMQVSNVSGSEMTSNVVVESVEPVSDARTFSASIPYTIESGKVFDFETTVSVEPGLDLSNYVIKVNEVPLNGSDYTYDMVSGKLVLQMDSSTIATISIEEASEKNMVATTLAETRATNDQLPHIPGSVTSVPADLYEKLDRGEQPVYVGTVGYNYANHNINKDPGFKPFVAWSSSIDSTIKNLADQIKNGGVDITHVAYDQGDLNYLLKFSETPDVPGWTWDNIFNVILKCGHISDPFTDTPDTSTSTGRVKIYWRVLTYNTNTITVAILTDRTHTQSGVGVFRINAPIPKKDVALDVYKTSANSAITDGNSNYSLAGAVYGIYSDYACTGEIGRVTTDSTGHGRKEGLKPGTYYVKEISASPGYELDTNVYTVQCN